MEELGAQLQAAKLEIENLKEQNVSIDAVWKNEKEVQECERCGTQFSTLIRKHHCRNCGGVYCNKCSDNKIPLPSYSRPMRVCDNCHVKLLQRYSAK